MSKVRAKLRLLVDRRPRWLRRTVAVLGCLVLLPVLLAASGWIALAVENRGNPAAEARSTGNDALWLGHAWVDGRKTQADVDRLAQTLAGTGIKDLLVHAGPFNDDGTLDRMLRPKAAWFVSAVHTTIPGVRVQAWLGAHPVPGQLDLVSAQTRGNLLLSAEQILDDGFEGIHYDFEPVPDGQPDLITVLARTHELTARRGAVLSVAASLVAPVPGMVDFVGVLPGQYGLWSKSYLHRVAQRVDQVALMAYDSWLRTSGTYSGYVKVAARMTLDAAPSNVAVLIGLPAYHDRNMRHLAGVETVSAAVRGVRLAAGQRTANRRYGVAMYVDFAATEADWASYRRDWVRG